MAARVKLNHFGMAELLKGAAAEAACRPVAEDVLSRAQGSAPVASGAYRDSLHIVEDETDRKRFRVVSDVPYAMKVEADTGNLARSL